jgi:metallo-beta-lactamase family protein
MSSTKNVSIQFLGAAGTVTGSRHLLKTPDGYYLIDCGLFQGLKALRDRNWEPLPVDASAIRAVLLTHAHLDHCGYLPSLGRQGFRGKVYCTAPTRELTEIILRDSAKIQEEDAAYANRRGFTRHQPALPLYTERDVESILPGILTVDVRRPLTLSNNITATFHPNGHILGSSYIEIECYGRRIVFSGDLGRPLSPLLPMPEQLVPVDFLIMESTYGDKLHPEGPPVDELSNVINDTIRNKGNLLIPSFAVGRAQELMHSINELKKSNRVPSVPVFMDSPMGADVADVLRRHSSWHKLSQQQCNAIFEDIAIIRDFADTLNVADMDGSKIVIAASGMLTGGRALFYLEKYLENSRNTILLSGFQSEGTRGRALLDGAHELKLHGSYYKVRAQVRSISSMSGHADQREMLDWLSQLKNGPEKTFLVHGENSPREAFKVKIETELGWNVELPEPKQEFALFSI